MDRPNIFSLATSELSQDAFLTWMLQWADSRYKDKDYSLFSMGQQFVRYLVSKCYDIGNLDVNSVEAGRQWEHMDIWADVNQEYFIVIEDKINTSEHDNQLEKYKKIVTDYYQEERKFVFIYLKTGLESLDKKNKIEKKEWKYCTRSDFVSFLNTVRTDSEIFNSYVENLKEMEESSKAYTEFSNLKKYESTKGLFLYLQEYIQSEIGDWSDWDYVPNPSGGFLGLWFYFTPCKKNNNREFYLQIENNCNGKCDLFIKICGEWNRTTDYLKNRLEYLQKNALQYELSVSKPSRFRVGEYTSLAIVNDVFVNKNGKLDIDNLINKINKSIKLVSDLAANS